MSKTKATKKLEEQIYKENIRLKNRLLDIKFKLRDKYGRNWEEMFEA